jgi:hypothetical protein
MHHHNHLVSKPVRPRSDTEYPKKRSIPMPPDLFTLRGEEIRGEEMRGGGE